MEIQTIDLLKEKFLPLLKIEEAAEICGVAPKTLRHWRAAGILPWPTIRVGRAIRLRLADICSWIDAAAESSAPPKRRPGRPRKQPTSKKK